MTYAFLEGGEGIMNGVEFHLGLQLLGLGVAFYRR
jgi:hypothetical protein